MFPKVHFSNYGIVAYLSFRRLFQVKKDLLPGAQQLISSPTHHCAAAPPRNWPNSPWHSRFKHMNLQDTAVFWRLASSWVKSWLSSAINSKPCRKHDMSQCDLAAFTTSACVAIQRDIFWAFTIIEKDKNCSSLSSYFQAIWLSYPSGSAYSSIEYLWNIRHFKACWALSVHDALRRNILLQLDHMFMELVVNPH